MADPASLNLPTTINSFVNKYRELLPQYGADALAPLMQLDYNRVIHGSPPVPKTITIAGHPYDRTQSILHAVQTGQTGFQKAPGGGGLPSFLEPVGDIFSAGVSDIGQLVRSIPQLPGQLVKTARELPQAPAEVQQAFAEGKPLHAFNAPGLNLIPGAYIAGQGTHVLKEHPVFSALDVAPYASELAPVVASTAIRAGMAFTPEFTEGLQIAVQEARNASRIGPVARGTARVFAQAPRKVVAPLEEAGVDLAKVSDESLLKLQKQANASAHEELATVYGQPLDELEQGLMPYAKLRARFSSRTPEAELQGIIEKNYRPWKGKGPIRKTEAGYEEVPLMVPKQVQKVTTDISKAGPTGGLALVEKPMHAFRTAVLPLSPKWHINNVVTGGILSAAQLGPGAIFDIVDAFRMAKRSGGIFGRGIREEGALPVEVSQGWSSLGDTANSRMNSRNAAINRIIPKALADGGTRLVDNLYGVNGFVDNAVRALNYIYSEKKALRKGATAEEAADIGIKQANRVLQDWDAQTPFERQVLRTVFPFYGWTHHILKYAAKYPAENPWRASIVSSIARNEINDWKTGLPQDFQNYLFWGRDKLGNEKGFNFRGMNPFSDLDTLFTLPGAVRNLNPIASGFFKQLGLNTFTGQPNLFQNVDYDPNTGRLIAQQPSTLGGLYGMAQGFLPQLTALRALTGKQTAQEKSLQQNNPAAYHQMVLSSLGIPWSRTVNKQLETAKAEYAAGSAFQQSVTQAIKSGDYSQLERYPMGKTIAARLKELDTAGALDQYKIQLSQPAGIQSPTDLIARLQGGGG